MVDHNSPLRRVGRRRLPERIHAGRLAQLADLFDHNEGAVTFQPNRPRAKSLTEKNWRVRREGNEVLAIEPGWRHENPFVGPNAYWDAVEYAAAELRKGGDGDDD